MDERKTPIERSDRVTQAGTAGDPTGPDVIPTDTHRRPPGVSQFGAWLSRQVYRDDGVGDVARDYVASSLNSRGDAECCQRHHAPRAVMRHVAVEHEACADAIEALKRAIAEYRALPRSARNG
jgi:hypothetical protein